MNTENTADPKAHCDNIRRELDALIQHARADIARVPEPRFQALLETTAEVLSGLRTAYDHYDAGDERAWGDQSASKQA